MTARAANPQKRGVKPDHDVTGRRAHARGPRGYEAVLPTTLPGWEDRAAAEILGALPVGWGRMEQALVAAIIREHAGALPRAPEAEAPGPIVCAGEFAIGNLGLLPGVADETRVQIEHADGEAGEFPAGELAAALEEFFWRRF